jgi:glutathione S-transferase
MITLYAHVNRTSPNTLKLRAALAEAGARYEYRAVDLDGGDQKRPDFLALNPHGKIPVLVEGDFTLAESDAILWYIGELFPEAALLPRTADGGRRSVQDRARVLQWCNFSSTGLHQAYLDLRIHGATPTPASGHRMPSGDTPVRSRDERIHWMGDAAAAKMERLLGVMDGVLARRRFLAGDFSLADLAAASVIHAIKRRLPRDPTAGRDAIAVWYGRVTARPAWQQALSETP